MHAGLTRAAWLAGGMLVGFGFGQFKNKMDERPLVESPTPKEEYQSLSALIDKAAETVGLKEKRPFAEFVDEEKFFPHPVTDAAGFDAFLERHEYSKESLLAAIHLDQDPARHLIAAAERFPDDAHFQFLILLHDTFPEDRFDWLRRFKESAPDNALASAFMAKHQLESGDQEAAIEQLRLVVEQGHLDDYNTATLMASDAALLEFDYSPLEAKMKGTFLQSIPVAKQFQQVFRQIRDAAVAAEDPGRKADLATLGAALANEFTQGSLNRSAINRLVGLEGESRFLRLLDPNLQSPNFSGTPQELLAELDVERKEIRELVEKNSSAVRQDYTEAELNHYFDRVRSVGEIGAIRWANERGAELE